MIGSLRSIGSNGPYGTSVTGKGAVHSIRIGHPWDRQNLEAPTR